jgi:hypothetical protein
MIRAREAIDQVQRDVESALREQLPGGEGFALAAEFESLADDPLANAEETTIVVPWTWQGVNEGLLGLAPTRRPVTVRGVTVVTEGRDELMCERYVDWLPALAEAGIMISTRPIVDIRSVYSQEQIDEAPELRDALEELDRLRARSDRDRRG